MAQTTLMIKTLINSHCRSNPLRRARSLIARTVEPVRKRKRGIVEESPDAGDAGPRAAENGEMLQVIRAFEDHSAIGFGISGEDDRTIRGVLNAGEGDDAFLAGEDNVVARGSADVANAPETSARDER